MRKLISAIWFSLQLFLLIFFMFCFLHPATKVFRIFPDMQQYSAVYTPEKFTESADQLSNPGRGYYHISGYVLRDSDSPTSFVISPADAPLEKLILLEINLRNFADGPLSENALSQLDSLLSQYSSMDKELILRFLYDWDGQAYQTEPESIQIILDHMEQTSAIVNRYQKNILTLQGLFIGSYGEMHSSRFTDSESLLLLGNQLARVTDPRIYLAVRTPRQWRLLTGADSFEELSETSPFYGRLGLYNDGMLGSWSDLGTYPSDNREQEILFQNLLCQNVPNGGEVTVENPLNDVPAAVSIMSDMHISYLNSVYESDVLSKWKSTVWHSTDCYDGISGFDYIGLHLGYRYVLKDSLFQPADRGPECLKLFLQNRGFSANYHPLHFWITVLTQDGTPILQIPLKQKVSDLPSGETVCFTVTTDFSSLAPGTYQLFFDTRQISDSRQILYANTQQPGSWGYHTGTITVYHLSRSVPRIR